MTRIEKYEKVFEGINHPVSRRVFGQIFLGATIGGGLAGYSLLHLKTVEAAQSVDCNVTMFHIENSSVIGRVISQNEREGRVPVRASQLVSIIRDEIPAPGERLFCLTFDDGYLSHYESITPFLESVGIPGTFFVLDPVSWWGDEVHSYVRKEQARDMVDRGMEVQSHGLSHQNLVGIKGSERYWADLTASKLEIEEVLQRPVEVFCYPFGAYDQNVSDDVASVGYRGAMSTNSGTIQSSELLYRILRRKP